MNIIETIASELRLAEKYVASAIELIDGGKTVPFIARYRKEATGSMDDQQLRTLCDRLNALRSLEKRGAEIVKALQEQGVLTPEIEAKIHAASTLSELEDVYRPYRPKRRTRAMIARERGLEPLAALIMLQRADEQTLLARSAGYVNAGQGVESIEDALSGARDIIAEDFSNDPALRSELRASYQRTAIVRTRAAQEGESVYDQYAGFSEAARTLPAHRILAINRGEREEFLKVSVEVNDEALQNRIVSRSVCHAGACADQITLAAQDAWKRLIEPSLERELRGEMTERASESGIREFSRNLKQLLMQPPVKGHVTLGVDPGFRTGCKLAVVDESGRVLDTGVAYFTLAHHEKELPRARAMISGMIKKHGVTAVAIGNGTASRESEAFIAGLIRDMPGVRYAIVSEAGASVYSASKLGAEEFPDFDVTLRSAVAIARRLQDPLAELVKVDPKSLGVGQYQHDLKEARLNEALGAVVEDCVNAVGVELSTASASLLSHVAGIGPQLAKNIVAYRDEHGFASRAELKKVPKLGPRAFEQCAGFLRLRDAKNVLDASGVHPESYAAARKAIELLGYAPEDMRGGAPADFKARAEEYGLTRLAEAAGVGLPTMQDIIRELAMPGRDPRADLPPVVLRKDVLGMEDLKPGMELQGTVRNVIDFGAFVDIGVHQDGLVHISRMARRFIRHPSEAVKLGDVVTVWVVDVDLKKKRISLSMLKPE